MGRITSEDACDQAAFLAVIITSDIFPQKILQTIDSIDDNGGDPRTHDIALRSQDTPDPPARCIFRMSAADKGLIRPVLLRDYNLDHWICLLIPARDQPLILSILTRV